MIKYKKIAGMLALIIFLAGCKEVKITTTIHPDGSIERSITAKGDSASVPDTAYPFPTLDSWSLSTEKKDDGLYYTTTKKFANAEELNAFFFDPNDSIRIRSQAQLQKKFRWFYTSYSYEETFKHLNPFSMLPMSEYLTDEEYQLYLADKDSNDIDKKLEEWQARSFFEEFYQALYQSMSDEQTLKKMDAQKEMLYESIKEWNFDSEEFAAYFLTNAEKVIGTSTVRQAAKGLEKPDQKFRKYFRLLEKSITEGYDVIVQMPGSIIETTAAEVDRNAADWKIDIDQFNFRDYTVKAESRRLNLLPTILSGLFIVFGLTGLIFANRQTIASWAEKRKTSSRKVLNIWISAFLCIFGLGLSVFAGVLVWTFIIKNDFFISWMIPGFEKAIMALLLVIGLASLLTGVVHLFRWRARRQMQL